MWNNPIEGIRVIYTHCGLRLLSQDLYWASAVSPGITVTILFQVDLHVLKSINLKEMFGLVNPLFLREKLAKKIPRVIFISSVLPFLAFFHRCMHMYPFQNCFVFLFKNCVEEARN